MMSFLRILVVVLIWMNLVLLSISMVILLILICWLIIHSNWHWMHHMNNFYQVPVFIIIFCLLQNALDFSCSPLGYGINILGIFSHPSRGSHRYFIIFINDFFRYAHVFLLHKKSDSLKVFKTFQLGVERQLNQKMKVVRSDRGREYYD